MLNKLPNEGNVILNGKKVGVTIAKRTTESMDSLFSS